MQTKAGNCTDTRDKNMGLLVQSISTFVLRLTYAPAPNSYVLISSSKSSILLEFMNSWNLTFETMQS